MHIHPCIYNSRDRVNTFKKYFICLQFAFDPVKTNLGFRFSCDGQYTFCYDSMYCATDLKIKILQLINTKKATLRTVNTIVCYLVIKVLLESASAKRSLFRRLDRSSRTRINGNVFPLSLWYIYFLISFLHLFRLLFLGSDTKCSEIRVLELSVNGRVVVDFIFVLKIRVWFESFTSFDAVLDDLISCGVVIFFGILVCNWLRDEYWEFNVYWGIGAACTLWCCERKRVVAFRVIGHGGFLHRAGIEINGIWKLPQTVKHAQREFGILEHIHISMALNIRAGCLYVYSKDFVDCLGSRRVFQTVCQQVGRFASQVLRFFFWFFIWRVGCEMYYAMGFGRDGENGFWFLNPHVSLLV